MSPELCNRRDRSLQCRPSRSRTCAQPRVRRADTDITIFLDVDCVATPTLVDDYLRSSDSLRGICAGPVGYLPPGDHDHADVAAMIGLAHHHTGRPQPGQPSCRAPGHEMFWSLSFAIDRVGWEQIGGFDERFVGYGGEDTDFARTALDRDVPIWFCGVAQAFHLYHPTTTPPVQHIDAICRNAATYHDKWGEWPMSGWLQAFADASLIRWNPDASAITRGAEGFYATGPEGGRGAYGARTDRR